MGLRRTGAAGTAADAAVCTHLRFPAGGGVSGWGGEYLMIFSVLGYPPLPCRASPPQGGRMNCGDRSRQPPRIGLGEERATGYSPPLRGRCPAGQRGVAPKRIENVRPIA